MFDLYFRKNPFGGEYTVFAGLEECIRFIANFKLSKEEIAFVRETLSPTCEDAFFDYLEGIDCSDVEVYAIAEGSVVFPKIPMMRVEGPVAGYQAGKIFGIPLRGTHSHAFVSSFMRLSILKGVFGETNPSELAAFISYAMAFPDNF
ncbi:hypothetical protein L2E82_03530 [Cichorium intybus]|uniref:Uncharacterized protein n=1 Tax=Cichorium intybus TaxID=13427 RepID=A0ACB9H402_CICIN|nr:hypothetical protein L2E82_03530 [Cichorium intybus]